jgi:hypothetical protein
MLLITTAITLFVGLLSYGKWQSKEVYGVKQPPVIAYQNAWEELRKYYKLTDVAHRISAATILLYPSHRKRSFNYY